MSHLQDLEFRVFPGDCDARGNLGHGGLVGLFERAFWESLSRGPGFDLFMRNAVWLQIARQTVEVTRTAVLGQLLTFRSSLTVEDESTLLLGQSARFSGGGAIVAEAESALVLVDADGRRVSVPEEFVSLFAGRRSQPRGSTRNLAVRGYAASVDVQGDGPAILFIHGFPLDRTIWRHQLATISGWRRIAPDLRGLGLSDGPATGYTMAEYADDAAALLDLLGIEEVVVAGLSMGGYVAFEIFRRHPGRVQALVLVNTRAGADSEEARARREEMIALVEREGPEALVDVLMPKLLAPASLTSMPQVVDHVQAMIAQSPKEGVIGALRAMKDRPDSEAFLAEINVPTLVVAGSDDQLIPTGEARRMAGLIPGAQFTTIPAAGHLAPLEQPIGFSRVLSEFLESLT